MPVCRNALFANDVILCLIRNLSAKRGVSQPANWRNAVVFAGMPLAQAVAILQKHCRIVKNVQVLYSEQVSTAGLLTSLTSLCRAVWVPWPALVLCHASTCITQN